MGAKVFECKMCGDCCRGIGGIYLNVSEIFEIASGLGTDIHSFLKKYCEISSGNLRLRSNKSGYCIFYDPHDKCTIHPFKPSICSLWPFFPANIKDPNSFEIAKIACLGIKKGISHKEFVEAWQKLNDRQ